jgi:hypothetical protein
MSRSLTINTLSTRKKRPRRKRIKVIMCFEFFARKLDKGWSGPYPAIAVSELTVPGVPLYTSDG